MAPMTTAGKLALQAKKNKHYNSSGPRSPPPASPIPNALKAKPSVRPQLFNFGSSSSSDDDDDSHSDASSNDAPSPPYRHPNEPRMPGRTTDMFDALRTSNKHYTTAIRGRSNKTVNDDDDDDEEMEDVPRASIEKPNDGEKDPHPPLKRLKRKKVLSPPCEMVKLPPKSKRQKLVQEQMVLMAEGAEPKKGRGKGKAAKEAEEAAQKKMQAAKGKSKGRGRKNRGEEPEKSLEFVVNSSDEEGEQRRVAYLTEDKDRFPDGSLKRKRGEGPKQQTKKKPAAAKKSPVAKKGARAVGAGIRAGLGRSKVVGGAIRADLSEDEDLGMADEGESEAGGPAKKLKTQDGEKAQKKAKKESRFTPRPTLDMGGLMNANTTTPFKARPPPTAKSTALTIRDKVTNRPTARTKKIIEANREKIFSDPAFKSHYARLSFKTLADEYNRRLISQEDLLDKFNTPTKETPDIRNFHRSLQLLVEAGRIREIPALAKKQPFRVMDLELKIRQKIWEYAVVDKGFFVHPAFKLGAEQPDLAMVSKQVREEVLPIYYEKNTFAFEVSPEFVKEGSLQKLVKYAEVISEKGWLEQVGRWVFSYTPVAPVVPFGGKRVQDDDDGSFIASVKFARNDGHLTASMEVHRDAGCILDPSKHCGNPKASELAESYVVNWGLGHLMAFADGVKSKAIPGIGELVASDAEEFAKYRCGGGEGVQ